MTQFVKQFIEKHIQLIEDTRWGTLFLWWYHEAEDLCPDDKDEFKQFISILHDAGIEPDLHAAHSVIQGVIEDKIIVEKNSVLQSNKHVSIFTIVHDLTSFLGHTEQDIKKIIDETATKLGMRYTEYYGGGYTW